MRLQRYPEEIATRSHLIGDTEPHLASPHNAAREDLAFCLPVSIELNHRDLARDSLIALHIVTALMVLHLPGLLLSTILFALILSLKLYMARQQRLHECRAIQCGPDGQWALVSDSGVHQFVRLSGIRLSGEICVIALRRFGEPLYWITTRSRQRKESWVRLRVLARQI